MPLVLLFILAAAGFDLWFVDTGQHERLVCQHVARIYTYIWWERSMQELGRLYKMLWLSVFGLFE